MHVRCKCGRKGDECTQRCTKSRLTHRSPSCRAQRRVRRQLSRARWHGLRELADEVDLLGVRGKSEFALVSFLSFVCSSGLLSLVSFPFVSSEGFPLFPPLSSLQSSALSLSLFLCVFLSLSASLSLSLSASLSLSLSASLSLLTPLTHSVASSCVCAASSNEVTSLPAPDEAAPDSEPVLPKPRLWLAAPPVFEALLAEDTLLSTLWSSSSAVRETSIRKTKRPFLSLPQSTTWRKGTFGR